MVAVVFLLQPLVVIVGTPESDQIVFVQLLAASRYSIDVLDNRARRVLHFPDRVGSLQQIPVALANHRA
uniref:Putative secreted protein n=1 Tax=Anopheles marajoara TaxID=58244 RepID=A0A2M4CG17_9DIPT